MALAERGLCEPTVSLDNLLRGDKPVLGGSSPLGLEDYAGQVTGSGFPSVRDRSERATRAFLDGYIDRIAERHVHEQGRTVRDRSSLRRWMAAYAAASSTPATFETIRDAASPGESQKPTRATTIAYRAVLEGLRVIDDVPAWLSTRSHLRRLSAAPVHQLADPAPAARLLEVKAESLLEGRDSATAAARNGSLLGALFQSLVTLSVRTYAQANESKVFHLRTHRDDHEVDLIAQGAHGRVAALEAKLAATVSERDTAHLVWATEAGIATQTHCYRVV